MKLFFILGNQLFPPKYLDRFKKTTYFLWQKITNYALMKNIIKIKSFYFLSSMRSHAENLKKDKFKLEYLRIEDKDFKDDYTKKLKKLINSKKIKEISSFEIEDKFFEKKN